MLSRIMVSLCHQSLPRQPSQFDTLQALITAVDRKDHYTLRHSEQVATYAVRLARASGLGADEQRILRTAGILHDVGKICIPESLLRKPGKLTRDEKSVVDFHVAFGARLIHDVPDEEQVRVAVAAHHERWDGLGYPSELEGENIPLLGRVLAVADTYSALTTKRPYRNALEPQEAKRKLITLLGTQLDPTLGRLFVESSLEQGDTDDDVAPSIFSFPPSCGNCMKADRCERALPVNTDLANIVPFPGVKRPSM